VARSAPNPPRQILSSLDHTYRSLARAWTADELADRYHAAVQRGAADLPADEEPPDPPITQLATAIPRLISLAVATTVLHTLPDQAHASGAGLADALLATIDATAAGSLHRGHLALHADGQSRGYDADAWLTFAYDQAAHALNRASPTTDPPSLIEHAQQAGRFAAIAIGSLDAEAPSVPETICDCLGHLLFVCVFTDATSDHPSA
jgi:hypothetical protein